MIETAVRGATWKLVPCPGCRARRMMPRENTSWLFCAEGLERVRPTGSGTPRRSRRPSVPVTALRLLREARGLTIAGLARDSGVDYTTVMRLEVRSTTANPRRAQAATAAKLARALGIGVGELAGYRGGPSTNVCVR